MIKERKDEAGCRKQVQKIQHAERWQTSTSTSHSGPMVLRSLTHTIWANKTYWDPMGLVACPYGHFQARPSLFPQFAHVKTPVPFRSQNSQTSSKPCDPIKPVATCWDQQHQPSAFSEANLSLHPATDPASAKPHSDPLPFPRISRISRFKRIPVPLLQFIFPRLPPPKPCDQI